MRNVAKMVLVAALAGTALTACTDEATTASDNISTAADNFKVLRRVSFTNGITGDEMLVIEGFCNIVDEGNQLEVTCKVAEGDDAKAYLKHFLGLSDNVTYVAEQLDAIEVDPFHHEFMVRPESLIPDPNLETSGEGN
jgi:hypothetical protein